MSWRQKNLPIEWNSVPGACCPCCSICDLVILPVPHVCVLHCQCRLDLLQTASHLDMSVDNSAAELQIFHFSKHAVVDLSLAQVITQGQIALGGD